MLKKYFVAAIILAAAVIATVFVHNKSIMRLFKREVLISIAGDILLDRGVADAIELNGSAYPFDGVSQLFIKDDITIANLECPLTTAGSGAMKEKRFIFKADPGIAGALKSAGFNVLVLANNHTMDYLSAGLNDTMEALGNAGLHYTGAGQSKGEIKPCFIEKNKLRIGVLSYSSLPPEGFMHDDNNATIAYARSGFLEDMQSEITAAAAQCDFLIACFHWGTEYRHDVNDSQIEIAHAAVDSGASAVIGTHPHVLQGKEIYNGTPIYYSIGNFVFDKQIQDGTDEAVILQFSVGKNGIADIIEIPVVIKGCQPYLADDEKAVQIKENIMRYSRRFE